MRYDLAVRRAALRRLLPPESRSLEEVSKEMNIRVQTLSNWKKKAFEEGIRLNNEDGGPSIWITGTKEAQCLDASCNDTHSSQDQGEGEKKRIEDVLLDILDQKPRFF